MGSTLARDRSVGVKVDITSGSLTDHALIVQHCFKRAECTTCVLCGEELLENDDVVVHIALYRPRTIVVCNSCVLTINREVPPPEIGGFGMPIYSLRAIVVAHPRGGERSLDNAASKNNTGACNDTGERVWSALHQLTEEQDVEDYVAENALQDLDIPPMH